MNRPLPRPAHVALALLCTALLLSAASAARAQQAQSAVAGSGEAIVSASDLQLGYFIAKHADVDDLQLAVQGMGTRQFFARNADGSVSGPVVNVRRFGNSTLVVYDVPERVAQVMKSLEDLDEVAGQADAAEEAHDGGPKQPLVVAEYVPRNVPLEALASALKPFLRMIGPGVTEPVRNITYVESPSRIVLRDTAENVQNIQELLERVDVPAPQLILNCWLLHGTDKDSDSDLPSDLVDNLRRLVPFRGFETVSMAMLRASVSGGQEQRLRGRFQRGDEEQRFDLSLVPAGYDARTQTLTLRECKFESSTGQEFSTAAVVKLGEYVALGAAGSDPLFVVLKVSPIER